MPLRGLSQSIQSGINLNPRPMIRPTTHPRRLHVLKMKDQLYSLGHTDACLIAFLNHDAAHSHRDYLWRSFETTGSLLYGLENDHSLKLPYMKEAKPVNSDGETDLIVDEMFFNDLRDICFKNIISLLIVTAVSRISLDTLTYHCHKYELDISDDRAAGMLEKNWK